MHQIEAKKAGFVSIVKRREHKLFEILKNLITNVFFYTFSLPYHKQLSWCVFWFSVVAKLTGFAQAKDHYFYKSNYVLPFCVNKG